MFIWHDILKVRRFTGTVIQAKNEMTVDAEPQAKTWEAPLLLLCVGTLLGSTFALAKLLAVGGMPPLSIAFWQNFGAGLLLGLAAWFQGKPPALNLRLARYYLIAGLVSMAFPFGLGYLLVEEIGASILSFVVTFPSLLTYIIVRRLGLEPANRNRLIGFVIGLTGLSILFLSRPIDGDGASVTALLLSLLVPVSLALGNVYRTVAWPPGAQPLQLAAGMVLGAALLLLGVILAVEDLALPRLALRSSDAWLFALMPVAALGYGLFFRLQRIGGPVYLSQIGYVIAVTGVVLGIGIFGEHLGLGGWVALAIVFLGLFIAGRKTMRTVPVET